MAATWTASAQDILFAQNKCMLGIFNATGSGVVLRLYRIWVLNNQTTAVTGVLTNLEIRKLTAASGGTTVTPSPHDTSSTPLPSEVTAFTNATITPSDLLRRIIWSCDEPAANAAITMDEFETIVPLNCVWSMGYADTTTEPMTIREDEGIAIVNTGSIVGQADLFFEFTSAAS